MNSLAVCFALLSLVSTAGKERPSLLPKNSDECIGAMRMLLDRGAIRLGSELEVETIDSLGKAASDDVIQIQSLTALNDPRIRAYLHATDAFLAVSRNEGGRLLTMMAMDRAIDPSKVRVLAALPTSSSEVRATWSHLTATYDEEAIGSALRQMQSVRKVWPEEFVLRPVPDRSMAAQALEAISICEQDGLVILFAHSEAGILRFPDASLLDMRLLGAFTADAPMPVVLSCETLISAPSWTGVGTLRRLDFEDTGVALRDAIQGFRQASTGSLGTLLRLIEGGLQRRANMPARKARFLLRCGVGVTATGGITLGVLDLSESSPKEPSMDELQPGIKEATNGQ